MISFVFSRVGANSQQPLRWSTMILTAWFLCLCLNPIPTPLSAGLNLVIHFYRTEYGKNDFKSDYLWRDHGVSLECWLALSLRWLCYEVFKGDLCYEVFKGEIHVARKWGKLLVNKKLERNWAPEPNNL